MPTLRAVCGGLSHIELFWAEGCDIIMKFYAKLWFSSKVVAVC